MSRDIKYIGMDVHKEERQLWTYSGLGIETRDSAQYCYVQGQLQRTRKPQ